MISITAAAVCSTGAIAAGSFVSASVNIAANLAPALGDVDLGHATGVQFPAKNAGQLLDVPVRVNSQGSKLLSYQIDLVWDAAHFSAVSCSVGGGWAADWACTLNDPPNKALIAASSLSSTATGSGVHVAGPKGCCSPRLSAFEPVVQQF